MSSHSEGEIRQANADADKLKGEMIESASQVVNYVSGNGGDFGRVDIQRAHIQEWLSVFG